MHLNQSNFPFLPLFFLLILLCFSLSLSLSLKLLIKSPTYLTRILSSFYQFLSVSFFPLCVYNHQMKKLIHEPELKIHLRNLFIRVADIKNIPKKQFLIHLIYNFMISNIPIKYVQFAQSCMVSSTPVQHK